MDIVCKFCGHNEGFYQDVEVTGVGYRNIEVEGHEDSSIVVTKIEDRVEEITYEDRDAIALYFGCANCLKTAEKIEDLIEVAEPEKIDPLAREQRFPRPGQETLT